MCLNDLLRPILISKRGKSVWSTRKAARRRPHLDRDIYAEPFPAPKRPLLVGDAFRVQARDGLAVVVRA